MPNTDVINYKKAKLYDADNDLNKTWYVHYSFRHPETDKMMRFKILISKILKTKSGRRKKAHEIIESINIKLARGFNPFAKQEVRLSNIKDAVEFAMKLKGSTLGKRSRWTYESVIRHFIKYLEKNKMSKMPIEVFNSNMAQKYFDTMLIEEEISKRTYNNRLTPLKTMFYILEKRGYVVHNAFGKIDKLKVSEPEIIAYSKSELSKIRNTLPKTNYGLYVITQLIFYCFLRPAEIVRLQFKDIIFDKGFIIIPGSKAKNGKSNVISMPKQFKENVKDWSLDYPAEFFIFSTNLKPGIREIAPTRIAGEWRKYADKNNINKNIYDLKHTGNGIAFDLGINPRDIQLQNRHSSLEQTQIYLNRFRRIASDKFNNDFNGF